MQLYRRSLEGEEGGGIAAVIGNPMTASADGKVNPECVRLISEMSLWPFKVL